jgi:hypothetical protein
VADQKLKYVVETDTTGAVRDLDKLGRAGEDAGKQIAEGFDTAASKSVQAIDKLITGLDEVTAESKRTVAAVDTIGAAFGEGFNPQAASGIVQALRRAGAEFDDIEAKAEELAAAMKRVDSVRLDGPAQSMRGMSGELDHVGDGLEKVHGEADQSRSVLANMAGNTTQSLGALGGVVGDLGMGLGQIAEYATEGNISMQGLAQMAGPFAALTVVSLGLQQALGNIAETKAWERDQVDGYTDAVNDAGDSIAAVLQMAEDGLTGRIRDESILGGLLDKEKTVDLIKLLDEAGLTLTDVSDAIRSGAHDRTEFSDWLNGASPEAAEFRAQFDDLANSGERYTPVMEAILSNTTAYTAAIEGAAVKTRVMASNVESVNEQLRNQRIDADPLAVLTEGAIKFGQVMVDPVVLWRQLVDDLRDGQADMVASAMAIDTFAAATGRSKEEIEALAVEQGKGTKAMADFQTHTEKAADAAEDAGVSFAEVGRILSSTDWDATSIQATSSAMQGFFDSATRGPDAVAGVYDALNALQDAFKEQRKAGGQDLLPNLSTPEGRATMDALEQLGTSLIPDITKAFDDSNGSADKFNESMTGLYQRTLNQLADQLHITQDEAKQLLAQIGLTPESFSTQYEMIGTEEAKLKLQLLQGVIQGLPRDVQARIAYQIQMGDYTGAVNTAVQYGRKHPIVQPTEADTSGAQSDIDRFRKQQASVPIHIPVRATTSAPPVYVKTGGANQQAVPAGVAALAGPVPVAQVSFPTAAPARSPVTVNVAIRAGAIGNRFDVERAVVRAVRSATRVGALAVPA